RYVATMAKKLRHERIFIDYLRNDRMNTAVAPYSTRARPGATVATPLGWEELGRLKGAGAYNIYSLRARLKQLKKDPWADFFATKQQITAAAMRAVGAGT